MQSQAHADQDGAAAAVELPEVGSPQAQQLPAQISPISSWPHFGAYHHGDGSRECVHTRLRDTVSASS